MELVEPSRRQGWRNGYEHIVISCTLWLLYSKRERTALRVIVRQIENDMRLPPLDPLRKPFGNDYRRNEAIYRAMTASMTHRRAALGIELAHSEQSSPKYRKHEVRQ